MFKRLKKKKNYKIKLEKFKILFLKRTNKSWLIKKNKPISKECSILKYQNYQEFKTNI